MAKKPRGAGKVYEKYCMDTLRTMYAAGIDRFTVKDFCSWSGVPRGSSMLDILERLVKRGWLSVVPREQLPGRSARTYSLKNSVWFGVQPDEPKAKSHG